MEFTNKKHIKIVSVCCNCKGEGHFDSPVWNECPFCRGRSWIYYKVINGERQFRGMKIA